MCQETHEFDELPPCMNKLFVCAQDTNSFPLNSLAVESPSITAIRLCCRCVLFLDSQSGLSCRSHCPPSNALFARRVIWTFSNSGCLLTASRIVLLCFSPSISPSLTTSCVCRRSFEGSSGYHAVILSLYWTAPSTPDTPTIDF